MDSSSFFVSGVGIQYVHTYISHTAIFCPKEDSKNFHFRFKDLERIFNSLLELLRKFSNALV